MRLPSVRVCTEMHCGQNWIHTATYPCFYPVNEAPHSGFEVPTSFDAVFGPVGLSSRVFEVACTSTAGLRTCLHEARAKCGLVLVPDLENHFPLAYAPPPVFGEP